MLRYIKLDAAVKPDELAALSYRLKGDSPDATVEAANEAVLLANPALRAMRRIAKGTVVLVPDFGGTLPPAKESEAVEMPLGKVGLLDDKQVASLAAEVAAGVQAAKDAAAETAAVLKATARRVIAEQAPGAEELLEGILEAAKAGVESLQKREKLQRKVLDRMAEDMKRLRSLR